MGKDSAVLAWVGLLIFIFLWVLIYDVTAHYKGWPTMTGQFRTWLHDPIMGPVVFGLWAFVFVALTFHFLVTK
jgi:hypothetical protein